MRITLSDKDSRNENPIYINFEIDTDNNKVKLGKVKEYNGNSPGIFVPPSQPMTIFHNKTDGVDPIVVKWDPEYDNTGTSIVGWTRPSEERITIMKIARELESTDIALEEYDNIINNEKMTSEEKSVRIDLWKSKWRYIVPGDGSTYNPSDYNKFEELPAEDLKEKIEEHQRTLNNFENINAEDKGGQNKYFHSRNKRPDFPVGVTNNNHSHFREPLLKRWVM